MLNIPSALRTQFEACLWNTAIPKRAHTAYAKWLRYYLDFWWKAPPEPSHKTVSSSNKAKTSTGVSWKAVYNKVAHDAK